MRNPVDMRGERYSRLTVVSDSGRRSSRGEVIWTCRCDCGQEAEVRRQNLLTGSVRSCGCLAKELSSLRGKARRKPSAQCSIDGCAGRAREYGGMLCRKHGQRRRRYGDPLYITTKERRRLLCREAALERSPPPKPDTYKKFLGRHEHRIVGEAIAGRKLRRDEHVHHVDNNKHNNDPSNLQILSASEHASLHARRGKHGA